MLGSLLFAAFALNFSIKTSLYDMVGAEGVASVSDLRSGTENKVVVIAVSDSPDRSGRAVREFVDSLPTEYRAADDDLSALAGLPALADKVCGEDAELLKTPEGRAKIAGRAIRRYIASPVPPLLKPEDDPFCLKERFLMSFATDSRALLPFSLPDGVTGDIDRLIETIADIRGRIAAANAKDPSVRLMLAGVPVHTAVTAGDCKRQIGWLTWFSLAFIAVLSVFVFRSVRWVPLLALSLLVACVAGAAAVFVCFDSVHIMTLVFGTTVLGLVIDYSFHWLLTPESGAELRRNLSVSWLTTEISLLPLALSSLPVLRQTAVFLAAALAAALAFVVFGYPKKGVFRSVAAISLLVFAAVFSVGCSRIRTDPKSIYSPPESLVEADRILAEKWSVAAEVTDDIAKLYEEQGGRVRAALGLREVRHVPAPFAVRPQAMLEELLDGLSRETLKRLCMALGFMFLALAFFFRGRALRMFLPSALALSGVLGLVLALDGAVNLFHLLAMFLLAGMSVDYTVFLHNGGKAALRPATCSLLTSMAGFGALYFVTFPVVSAFGLVLGVGLPMAFLLALLLVPRSASTEKAASSVGMEILYLVYRLFGLSFLRFGAAAVGVTVWLCSREVRKASPRMRKTVNFTRSLADKLVVMAEGRRLPAVTTDGTEDAKAFLDDVYNRRGVFVLSSHVGTIEVLAALGSCEATFHAWMEFERTGVFNRFYLRHAKRKKVVIHPISEFGMQTVFEAGDLIDSGECLLMAGDRGDGAFRFAAAFEHPVYFVACVAEGGGYKAVVRRLPVGAKAIRTRYFEILEELKDRYQNQWFEWNR